MKEFMAYVYVDPDHPLAAWETYRGLLYSSEIFDTPDMIYPSFMLAGIVSAINNQRLAHELYFESIRQTEFPNAVSRLRGLYFFPDLDCARRAKSWGAHFIFDNLTEVGVSAKLISKLDADWITKPVISHDSGLPEPDAVRAYWRGEPRSDSPHWELIVHGLAVVWGTSVRRKCYDSIKQFNPNALGMLELARVAAQLGSTLGRATPWIKRIESNLFEVCSIIDFGDAKNPAFLDKLSEYKGPRNWADLPPNIESLSTPDTRWMNRRFSLSITQIQQWDLLKVHSN
ncbi:MAG: hypothetical protein K8S54_03715 [Spirochaetia bacterium]|nr:hypothetical protein [Spirochaetia bacterium]